MASNPFDDLTDDWDVTMRMTFASETDVILSNPSDAFVFYAITTDTTVPTIMLCRANPRGPKSAIGLKMKAGEYLWLGGEGA